MYIREFSGGDGRIVGSFFIFFVFFRSVGENDCFCFFGDKDVFFDIILYRFFGGVYLLFM